MTPGQKALRTLVLTIWALPGIGIPTLLLFLQQRKRSREAAANANTPNVRGQYGKRS